MSHTQRPYASLLTQIHDFLQTSYLYPAYPTYIPHTNADLHPRPCTSHFMDFMSLLHISIRSKREILLIVVVIDLIGPILDKKSEMYLKLWRFSLIVSLLS